MEQVLVIDAVRTTGAPPRRAERYPSREAPRRGRRSAPEAYRCRRSNRPSRGASLGQPLLAQVFAYGDRRSYNVALVVVDRDGLAAFLQSLDPPVDLAE